MNKYFNIIILVLLVFIAFNSLLINSNTITPKEEAYKLRIHDLKKEKTDLLLENKKLYSQINSFKDEILKNDSIVDHSSVHQLDSMFTDYFTR